MTEREDFLERHLVRIAPNAMAQYYPRHHSPTWNRFKKKKILETVITQSPAKFDFAFG